MVRRRPPRAPPIVASRPIPRHAVSPRTAAPPVQGRLACVFGPPGSGVSSVIDILSRASARRCAVLQPTFGDLEEQIRALVAEVILVDGFPICGDAGDFSKGTGSVPHGPNCVQYLFDRRLVFPGYGAIVRVQCDPELLVRTGRATPDGLHAWFKGLQATEDSIRQFSLPYYVIHNEPGEEGLATCAHSLAYRIGVEE